MWFWQERTGPRIRFLAELIHNVYGFPLEPIQDAAVSSSKGVSNWDTKAAKVKEPVVNTTPDMDGPLPGQDWRHMGVKRTVLDGCNLEEEQEEVKVGVGEGESDLELRDMDAKSAGRRTKPRESISSLHHMK